MNKVHILIVENEPLYGDLLSEYLEVLDYEPLGPAPTAAQALTLFDSLKPDLVLLDIGLRGDTDGIELATQLLARRPVPLIFVTAATDRPTFERARTVGPVAFITKPFDAITLQNAVELALYNFATQNDPVPNLAPKPEPGTDLLVNNAFFLKERAGLVKVPYAEVLYVEADDKYAMLVLASGRRYPLRVSLKDVARLLEKQRFVQIHRSCVINAQHLESLSPADSTVQVAGRTLQLGRSYKEELLRRLHLIEAPE